MTISKTAWKKYITILEKIDKQAATIIKNYISRTGTQNLDSERFTDFIYSVTAKYGDAAAAVAAQFYDEIVTAEGLFLPAAELADGASYEEVKAALKGTLKTSQNANSISGMATRLIKQQGQDTMLKNGIRDRAEFAWIPSGDTCAFCLTLASNGWRPISKEALKGGHAEHIHANCNCAYAIRHKETTNYASYNPQEYKEIYDEAEGSTGQEKINYIRRRQYAENKDKINAQHREAYRLRKEAEEEKEA